MALGARTCKPGIGVFADQGSLELCRRAQNLQFKLSLR